MLEALEDLSLEEINGSKNKPNLKSVEDIVEELRASGELDEMALARLKKVRNWHLVDKFGMVVLFVVFIVFFSSFFSKKFNNYDLSFGCGSYFVETICRSECLCTLVSVKLAKGLQ